MTAPARTVVALGLIVAAGVWAYAPSMSGVFVFDDFAAIARNPHVRSVWPLSRSMTAPPDTTLAGRPVASLTFAVNYALAPADARETFAVGVAALPGAAEALRRNSRGYHLVNLAIHLLAAVTLFGVVRQTVARLEARGSRLEAGEVVQPAGAAANSTSDKLKRPGSSPKPQVASRTLHSASRESRAPSLRSRAPSLEPTLFASAVALLWVVHPLTTGAVTYIVQRVESLMALFYLLTLYCAIRAWTASSTPAFRRWAVAAVVACALGMGTKEVMVTAPLAVLAWWWVFGDGRSPSPWRLVAALCSTWIILAALVATAPRTASVGWTIAGWTPWMYLLTQAEVLLHYLRLVVWPAPLLVDYGWTPVRSLAGSAVPFVMLTAGLVATVSGFWRRRAWAYPAAMFFLILAPSSSVLPIGSEIAAEHRMYLPLAAVLGLAIAAAGKAVGRLTTPETSRLPAAALLAVAIVALGLASRDRGRDYWSQEQLWQHDIAHQPTYARPRVSYGVALFAAGRYADAEVHLRAAVALDPRDVLARANLGSVLCARGQLDEGIVQLEHALALEPAHPDALATIGDAHTARGDDARAVPFLTRALEARPDDVMRLNRLGWLLATSTNSAVRDPARALDLGSKAVTLTGRRDVMSLNTLAAAQAASGQSTDAVATMTAAIAVAAAQGLSATIPELERRRAAFAAGR